MSNSAVQKEDEVVKKPPSFLDKIKKYLHRQYKIDRFRFIMIAFMLLLALMATVISSKSYLDERSQYNSLQENAKELTWKEYVTHLEKNNPKIKEIQLNYYRTKFFPLGSGDVNDF